MTCRRNLALAILASALWGVSYPIAYLALRVLNVESLITYSYIFAILILLTLLAIKGIDLNSLKKGLLLAPVNYALMFIWMLMLKNVGGLTAVVSSSYIAVLLLLDYVSKRRVSLRHLLCVVTLLTALYLMFNGSNELLHLAFALMMLNLIYVWAIGVLRFNDVLSFTFGQALGTLLIALSMPRALYGLFKGELSSLEYPLLMAILSEVVPYILYANAIKRIGPVETSLTSSVETLTSLIASMPIQKMPDNALAWALLITSIVLLLSNINVNLGNSEKADIGKALGQTPMPKAAFVKMRDYDNIAMTVTSRYDGVL